MLKQTVPPWWQDIERACCQAVADFENILDILDRTLKEDSGHPASGNRLKIDKWTALQQAASKATERISSSFRLWEARRTDVQAAGFTPPEDPELAARRLRAVKKSEFLSNKLTLRINDIKTDLSLRRPRRPAPKLYRNHTPSYIDLCV